MQHESVPEIFYRMFFHAFGYTGNEQAYEILADSIPIHVTDSLRTEPMLMYALYIGQEVLCLHNQKTIFQRWYIAISKLLKTGIP